MSGSHDPTRLGRFETLGAWLHVWTPHRDAVVPPVPRRALALAAVGLAVLIAVIVLAIAPAIRRGKSAGEARRSREARAQVAAHRAQLVRDQAVHRGRGRPGDGLEARARAAVLADARSRVRTGALDGPIRGLRCDRTPGAGPGVFDCTAITDRIQATRVNTAGLFGYPFRLKVDAARGRFVWCKQNPLAGERSIPDPSRVVPLPRACQA